MVVDGRLAGVGERESVADVARVLGAAVGAVVWRTFEQARLEEMAATPACRSSTPSPTTTTRARSSPTSSPCSSTGRPPRA